MRKTKLIILPTRCLNRMGFLLLFLSCPVIGDWGRIRPDTEMSQWSILLDKGGSCGLTRNSQTSESVPGKPTEDDEICGGTPRNDKLLMTGNFVDTEKGKPEGYGKIQRTSERRTARRETKERRTVSFDRKNAFRRIESSERNYRTIAQEYNRRSDARRLPLGRRVRCNTKVISNNSRRSQRRENDVRRTESRVESRRVEERRLSRRNERDDPITRRVFSEMRAVSRVRDVESRNGLGRREHREDRRLFNGNRRSVEREVFGGGRKDNREERGSSAGRVGMRRDTSKERVSDGRRTAGRLDARREQSEPGMRRTNANSDARRNERSLERREALQRGETKRVVTEFIRRQDMRVGKPERREFNARERTARTGRYMGLESRIAKLKKMEDAKDFEFLGGIKNWFRHSATLKNWVMDNDFAKTCLVGATIYLLTTQQIKAV